jgi:uncharacterized protein DUF6516
MKRRATLVINRKITFDDGAVAHVVVWDLPVPLIGSMHRYKYRLYFGKAGVCFVRFDNEQGKGDHKHIAGIEDIYAFRDIPTLLDDFWAEVERSDE